MTILMMMTTTTTATVICIFATEFVSTENVTTTSIWNESTEFCFENKALLRHENEQTEIKYYHIWGIKICVVQ